LVAKKRHPIDLSLAILHKACTQHNVICNSLFEKQLSYRYRESCGCRSSKLFNKIVKDSYVTTITVDNIHTVLDISKILIDELSTCHEKQTTVCNVCKQTVNVEIRDAGYARLPKILIIKILYQPGILNCSYPKNFKVKSIDHSHVYDLQSVAYNVILTKKDELLSSTDYSFIDAVSGYNLTDT